MWPSVSKGGSLLPHRIATAELGLLTYAERGTL